MKAAILAVALLLGAGVGPSLSQAERDKALIELEGSQKAFLDATNGLSVAQWNFKSAPDRWSVAECAEHIGVTEGTIYKMIVEQALKAPAEPGKHSMVKITDDELLAKTVDRSAKFKAPEAIQPTHRWTTPDEITKNVLDNRAQTLAFVSTT
jgi:predicted DNA-binding transcriptional regulator YafY